MRSRRSRGPRSPPRSATGDEVMNPMNTAPRAGTQISVHRKQTHRITVIRWRAQWVQRDNFSYWKARSIDGRGKQATFFQDDQLDGWEPHVITNLKPCPFCGGPAEIEEVPAAAGRSDAVSFSVGCKANEAS